MNQISVKRALISVSDKTNLEPLASALTKYGVEMISSGGTGKALKEMGYKYTPINEVTGNPEAFGGRMKTLSFQISSSLLFRRDHIEDEKQAKELGINPIDLVVCNLYPFEEVAKKQALAKSHNMEELIENIDIGGPTMIRAAAKNYESVGVCVKPQQYAELLKSLEEGNGSIDYSTRKKLAMEAFRDTAQYDSMIASELESQWHAEARTFGLNPEKAKALRYGENPHQKAWVYEHPMKAGLAGCQPIQGKELSYNNLLDADAALNCTRDLQSTFKSKNGFAVSVVKHLNPCGAAVSDNALVALKLAWVGDPISSFGSILCFSGEVTLECAQWLADKFVEVIVAPAYSTDALELFSKKKNMRLIQMKIENTDMGQFNIRTISGGWVVQSEDEGLDPQVISVTEKPFPASKVNLVEFGTMVNKHLKSNAIALVKESELGYSLVGAGMGNPNRLVSTKQAIEKATENGEKDFSELILVSDAFFPFADNVELAKSAGIKNIVQPGGSIKDKEVIEKCNELDMTMIFTGRRHFRH